MINYKWGIELVQEAAFNVAQVIILPECFNSPYGTSYFTTYCEHIPGESIGYIRQVPKETKICLISGM